MGNGGVVGAAVEELVQSYNTVVILVHFLQNISLMSNCFCKLDAGAYLEYSIDFFFDHNFVNKWVRELPHEIVDRGDNVRHLLSGDAAVTVNVVQTKCPAQFLLKRTT